MTSNPNSCPLSICALPLLISLLWLPETRPHRSLLTVPCCQPQHLQPSLHMVAAVIFWSTIPSCLLCCVKSFRCSHHMWDKVHMLSDYPQGSKDHLLNPRPASHFSPLRSLFPSCVQVSTGTLHMAAPILPALSAPTIISISPLGKQQLLGSSTQKDRRLLGWTTISVLCPSAPSPHSLELITKHLMISLLPWWW